MPAIAAMNCQRRWRARGDGRPSPFHTAPRRGVVMESMRSQISAWPRGSMPMIAGLIISSMSQTIGCGPEAISPMPTTPSSVRTSTSVRIARANSSCAVQDA